MAAIANLVVRVAADVADFEKSFAGLERSLQRTGRNLESAGSRLTQGITLPIVALAGVAAKAAIDFESSFAGVRKTVDATEREFKQLEQGFRNLAKTMPLSVNEINRVAEAAGQLGVGKDQILAFTETMVKLGATTNLTAEEAATAMAQFANALGQPKIDADKLAASLVALGNNGASTEKDILNMAGRIAGAGAQIKLTAGSIFGISNALASVGIDAEKGGSAISRLFNDLNSAVSAGGQELKNFAAVAGESAESFRSLFKQDSASAITKFVEGLHAQKEAGTDLLKVLNELGITELRYRDTVLLAANAGPQFAASIKLGNDAFNEGTAANKEYAERLKTTASQLAILKNNLYDAAITLGQAFLPLINDTVKSLRPMVQSMANLAESFKQLPEPIRNSAAALLGIVAAVGPLAFAIGKVQQAWAAMLGLFGSGVLSSTISVLGRFAGPLAIVAAAVFALKETWEAFSESWTEGFRTLGSALPGFAAIDAALSGLASRFPALSDVMEDIVSIVQNGLIVAFDQIGTAFERVADVLVGLLNPAWDAAASALGRIGDVIQRVVVPALATALAQFVAMIPGVRGLADFAKLVPGFSDMAAALDRTAKSLEEAARGAGSFGAALGPVDLKVKSGSAALDTFRDGMAGLMTASKGAADGVGGVVKKLELGTDKLDSAGKKLAAINKKIADAATPLTKLQEEQVRVFLKLGLTVDEISTKLGASELRVKSYADEWQDLQKLISEVIPRIKADISSLPVSLLPGAASLKTAIPTVPQSSLMAPLVAALERDFAGIDLAALKARNAIADLGPNAQEAADTASKALKQFKSNLIDDVTDPLMRLAGEIPGIGGMFAQFGVQAANAFAKVATGALTAAQGIASLQGSAYALLFTMIAQGARESFFSDPAPVTRQNREDFLRQFGGQAGAENQASIAGPFIRAQLEGLDSIDALVTFQRVSANIAREIQDQQERLEAYGLTWRDFGESVRQATIVASASKLVKDFNSLTRAGANVDRVLEGMSDSLNDFIINAVRSGTKIPGAMQPILEQLIRTRNISDEAARALLGIADDGVPALEDIKEAAERYGLTLDQLGPKVAQLRINDEARQIVKDFELLTAAGAEATVVAGAMVEKIQNILDVSFKTGAEVPLALKPIIQILIDMGLLTDAAGNKLTNIDDIHFGKDLISAVDALLNKLQDLIDTLLDVGDAADYAFPPSLGGRPNIGGNPPQGPAIPRPVPGEIPQPLPGEPPPGGVEVPTPPPSGTRPRSLSFSSGTASQDVTAFGGTVPSGTGLAATSTVIIELDGRALTEVIAPLLPGEYQRYGVAL